MIYWLYPNISFFILFIATLFSMKNLISVSDTKVSQSQHICCVSEIISLLQFTIRKIHRFFSRTSWHWPFSSHNHYYHQREDLECCSSFGTSHHPKKYNIQFSSSSYYHHPSQYKHIFMKSEMLFASHATRPLSSWLTFGTTHYIASPLHSLTSFK